MAGEADLHITVFLLSSRCATRGQMHASRLLPVYSSLLLEQGIWSGSTSRTRPYKTDVFCFDQSQYELVVLSTRFYSIDMLATIDE
jgi:hypothetical protein